MKIRRSYGFAWPLLFCGMAQAHAQTEVKSTPSISFSLMTSDTRIAGDGSFVENLHVEMRAGNDAAVAQAGQIHFPYDAATQEISVVEAHTHKADGTNIPVETSAIYDQAPPGQQMLVTALRSKLIVFPQFAMGDTAVYTIKVTVQHPNFANQFFSSEFFPRALAYEEVRETITAPKNFPLSVESHDVEHSSREDGGNVIHSWHYSAPQPETEDTAWFSPLEHTPRFFVSSFKDYAELGRAYAALTLPKKMVTAKAAALADQIAGGTGDARTQAQKIYEWVSTHIRYVAIELGSGSFTPHDVDTIIANGYGDCKDHDLLLQVLLKAKGIEAQSILLNGGDTYFMPTVPAFTSLDHVITFVPQFNLYLDSTVQVAPFGILPMQEYGKPMVVASPTAPRAGTMPLLPPGLAKITFKTAAALDKDGWITGTSSTTASGPYAITLRTIGLAIQAAGPAAAGRFLSASGYADASGTFSQESPVGFGPDFTISGTFKASGWSDEAAGKSSFHLPGVMRLFGQAGDGIMGPLTPGRLKPGEPTLCFSASATEELSLKAPTGSRFQRVPEGLEIKTANLRYTLRWSLADDTLTARREFVSTITQPFCSGAIRTESAAALKKILDSYDTTVSLAPEQSPEDKAVAALYDSANAHFNAKQLDLAIADFTKILEMRPNEGPAYRGRGIALALTRKADPAIADVSKAVGLQPEDPAAYYARGRVQLILGRPLLALEDFNKALALNPDYFDAIAIRGEAYRLAGKSAQAFADFTKALAMRPGSIEVLDGRAHVHYERGEYQLAIADFDKVIARYPDLAEPLLFRGEAKNKLGRKADGARDIAAAIKLDPSLK